MNTSTHWLESLRRLTPADKAVLITITAVRGSTPRGVGTRMLVTANNQYDTIGGGHLEWKAIASARLWLAETAPGNTQRHIDLSLGPSLGQCCGGALSLCLERVDCWSYNDLQHNLIAFEQEQNKLPHLYLFGAGHVGTALVTILQQVPCRITWVDERDHLFPTELPANVVPEATDSPEAVIFNAEKNAYFLVMTHHHGLDLILSEHILRKPKVAWFGLIGSQTKRARFENRLQERGIAKTQLQEMICPVGIEGIDGKEPGVIAVAIAAQLLQLWAKPPTLSAITSPTITSEIHL